MNSQKKFRRIKMIIKDNDIKKIEELSKDDFVLVDVYGDG